MCQVHLLLNKRNTLKFIEIGATDLSSNITKQWADPILTKNFSAYNEAICMAYTRYKPRNALIFQQIFHLKIYHD